VQFASGAWAVSGDKKFVKALPVGGKFYLDGVPFEVSGTGAGKMVQVTSLTSGKTGMVNGAYSTNYLKLKEGYTEEGLPAFDPGDFFGASAGEALRDGPARRRPVLRRLDGASRVEGRRGRVAEGEGDSGRGPGPRQDEHA